AATIPADAACLIRSDNDGAGSNIERGERGAHRILGFDILLVKPCEGCPGGHAGSRDCVVADTARVPSIQRRHESGTRGHGAVDLTGLPERSVWCRELHKIREDTESLRHFVNRLELSFDQNADRFSPLILKLMLNEIDGI